MMIVSLSRMALSFLLVKTRYHSVPMDLMTMRCVVFEGYSVECLREIETAGPARPWQLHMKDANGYVQKAWKMSDEFCRESGDRITCAILFPYNEEPVLFDRRLATPFRSVLWVTGVSIVGLWSPAAVLFWLGAKPVSKFECTRECFGEGGGDREALPALIGGSDGCHRSIEHPFTGWVCGAMWVSCGS